MADGLIAINVTEATGGTAAPADLDRLSVTIGCSSAGSGLQGFYLSGSSAIAGVGYGDGPDALCQIIEQVQDGAASEPKKPGAFYTVAASTPGYYGTVDTSGVTGTAVCSVDAAVLPYNTNEARFKVIAGGIVGVEGITAQVSTNAGRDWSNTFPLGTAVSYTIPNRNVKFTFLPSTTNAAYVTLAVELRADSLAHMANATAHDGADTNAGQVALAASSVPGTVTASTAVVNLVLTALGLHARNITSVHDGPDLVMVTALALLSAATTPKEGIDLANALKAILNAHEARALASSATALMGATASIAAPTTYTAAGSMLAGGIVLMDAQPRRPTVTTGAGGTPSDMPATAALSGFDLDGTAQSETLTLSQSAGTATAAKAYKGTGFQAIFATADGTGATWTMGIEKGVHNSADSTNTISAADATYGTLIAGDVVAVRTFAPAPNAAAIDAAFAALAAGGTPFTIVVCEWPMTAALAARVTIGLNLLRTAKGRRVYAIGRTRLPDFEASETEEAWKTSIAADFAAFYDSRIHIRATYGLLRDASTGYEFMRSDLAQHAADVVRVGRAVYAGSPSDRAVPNFKLTNALGVLIGHDDGPGGNVTGLSNTTLGNRFGCNQRLPNDAVNNAVFNTFPWVMYNTTNGERILSEMARRTANAMERVAAAAAIPAAGSPIFYTPADPSIPGSTPQLTETSRNALHGRIFQALADVFADDVQNIDDDDPDTGLVRVATGITVGSGGLVTTTTTLAPRGLGYLMVQNFVYALQA